MIKYLRKLPNERALLRCYATHSFNTDPIYDESWPKSSNPTPYDIFGLPPGQVDPRLLKKKYYSLAKLYHPDITNNITILTSKKHHKAEIDSSNIMSLSEKMERFRMLSEAYEILGDLKKKSTYDRFKTGWSHSPTLDRSAAYASATSHGYHQNYNYEYWNAGTWEEVNNLKNKDTKKLSPWVIIAWVCGLFGCIEFTALLTRIEDSLTKNHFTHDETERDLVQAYINYGLDTDKWSRLRRFLWFRTYSLYRNKDDLDREAKKNEKMVQTLRNKEEGE